MDNERKALLVTGTEAARLCGVSERTWRSWNAAGLVPKPRRIGRKQMWSTEELRAWIGSGCPPRSDWTWQQAI